MFVSCVSRLLINQRVRCRPKYGVGYLFRLDDTYRLPVVSCRPSRCRRRSTVESAAASFCRCRSARAGASDCPATRSTWSHRPSRAGSHRLWRLPSTCRSGCRQTPPRSVCCCSTSCRTRLHSVAGITDVSLHAVARNENWSIHSFSLFFLSFFIFSPFPYLSFPYLSFPYPFFSSLFPFFPFRFMSFFFTLLSLPFPFPFPYPLFYFLFPSFLLFSRHLLSLESKTSKIRLEAWGSDVSIPSGALRKIYKSLTYILTCINYCWI